MFHIINSMSLFEFTIFMIISIVICIVALIKSKGSQRKWRAAYYLFIIGFCFFIAQRAVSEYMPGTTLAEIGHVLMFASFPAFWVIVIVIAYYANRDKNL